MNCTDVRFQSRMTGRDKLIVWMIFVHYLVFEVVFFFWYDFLGPLVPILIIWKSAFPAGLFLYGLRDMLQATKLRPALTAYIILFVVLLGAAGISSALSSTGSSGFLEWVKLPPRLLFFLGVVGFLSARPRAFVLFSKLLVVWATVSVAQYLLLILGGYRFSINLPRTPVTLAGPLGLLGNISSLINSPGLSFPIVRLCGFWNEPSNASASMFVAYCLARFLYNGGEGKYWRALSAVCFCGGVACLSNAGYTAIACAVAFGSSLPIKGRSAFGAKSVAAVGVAAAFVLVGLFGRSFVATHLPENELAKAFVGVRVDLSSLGFQGYDASDGRIDLFETAITTISEHPLGTGVVTGREGIDNLSASAPITWFTYTGIFGLAVLLLREWILAASAVSTTRSTITPLEVTQAWIIVLVQQTSYGIWMSPLYMVLCAAILAPVVSRPIWDNSRATGFPVAEGRGPIRRGRRSAGQSIPR